MTQASISSLVLLAFILGAQFTLRPHLLLRIVRAIFLVLIIGSILLAGYYTYQQYDIWQGNEFSQLFLPPHQDISYFISYSFSNFFLRTLMSLLAALVGFFSVKMLNKKFKYRFFEPVEPYLFGTALLISGHPGLLYYLAVLLAISLILALARLIIFQDREYKFSFYYFWIPIALVVIIIKSIIQI